MKTKLFFVCQRKRYKYSTRQKKNRCRYTTIAADKYRLFHFLCEFHLVILCVCESWPSVIAIVLVIAAFGLDYYFVCVCICVFVLLQLCSFVAIIHIRLPSPLAEFRLHWKCSLCLAGLSFYYRTLSLSSVFTVLLLSVCHLPCSF